MTEQEAQNMWCPFVRFVNIDGEVYNNMPSGTDATLCISSSCMAWRVAETSRVSFGDETVTVTTSGYCGLAGDIG
jgi:hypothetical protein